VSALRGFTFENVDDHILKIRMIKSSEEISLLRKSAELTDLAAKVCVRSLKPGATELEVALAIERAIKERGAELAFNPIVASGPERSQMMSPMPSERKLREGDVVLSDFGARFKGYSGDSCLTTVIGAPSSLQKELLELVLAMHDVAIDAMKPGMMTTEVHREIMSVVRDSTYGKYARDHSHGLGIDGREPPYFETGDVALQPNMIFAVEPAVYISDVGGFRIEDMVLLTEAGCERLTKHENRLW